MIKGELFSTEMVRAYLEKRKLHTCRPIPKYAEVHECTDGIMVTRPKKYRNEYCRFTPLEPKYQPGDFMYCRETWCNINKPGIEPDYYYLADAIECEDYDSTEWKWHPSIHMPKEAARLFFRVTKVAIMHFYDIGEQFAIDDGFRADGNYDAQTNFRGFWEATYGEDARWMWVYWTDPVSKDEAGEGR